MTTNQNTMKSVGTFRPVGDVTIYTAGENKSRLLEVLADCAGLEVDVSQVSTMDTAGMQILVLARMEALRRKIPFTLVGNNAAVSDVIELCNLTHLFDEPPGAPYEQLARRFTS